MSLTKEQLKQYEDLGYVFLPEYLSQAEVEKMKTQLPSVFAKDSPKRVVEKEGRVVRSVYGSHTENEIFRRLTHHPKLVQPVMQILDSSVYVYQFKINAKVAYCGDVWDWHQDYIFWRKEDGMPSARVANVVVFLDEVTEFNGPMFFMPGSHREGAIDVSARDRAPSNDVRQMEAYRDSPNWISNLTSNLRYSLDRDTVATMAKKYGMVSPKGPSGSMLFFHCNLIHGSSNNISPFDRVVIIVTFNSTENIPVPVKEPRPDFLSSRDHSPIVPPPEGSFLL